MRSMHNLSESESEWIFNSFLFIIITYLLNIIMTFNLLYLNVDNIQINYKQLITIYFINKLYRDSYKFFKWFKCIAELFTDLM